MSKENKQPGRSICDIQGEINIADGLMRKAAEAHKKGNITASVFNDLAQLAAIGQETLACEIEDAKNHATGKKTKFGRQVIGVFYRFLFGQSRR